MGLLVLQTKNEVTIGELQAVNDTGNNKTISTDDIMFSPPDCTTAYDIQGTSFISSTIILGIHNISHCK
jgi:hypothetical protein